MREDGVLGCMTTHIGVGIGRLGSAEERQAHYFAGNREAIFGVVEDRHAVRSFTQVCPFVAAYFEFRHVPGRVVVGGALHDTELRLVACGGVCDIDGELDFEELHRLVPFDFCFDFNCRRRVADGCG